jgi:septum formation protein
MDLVFKVRSADVSETYPPHLSPLEVVQFLAQKKAQAVAFQEDNELIIGADTIVLSPDGQILGKPANEKDAEQLLAMLSGKTHWVSTGVCMRTKAEERVFAEKTLVRFKELLPEEITYYISRYKPFDKAGGYGIQEWIGFIGIEGIEGCYYNVMGFPCHRFYHELKDFAKRRA